MADEQHPNVSSDLVWECCRQNNAYLVKRKTAGGIQFSRDPYNLMNKHSRKVCVRWVRQQQGSTELTSTPVDLTNKYIGLPFVVGCQAIGILPAEKGGVTLITKKTKHLNRPASNKNEVTFSGQKSGPSIYKGVVNSTAKQGYRADLRQEAVARASAIRKSQQPKKEAPEKKLRGAKAKAAAEKDS
ncbi:trafficking protein particle complex subunit 6b [Physcia stellaris]|nr:trafficking protein particle complex subunit 6b [Physcia stellaris]